jgi:hypothetical protein
VNAKEEYICQYTHHLLVNNPVKGYSEKFYSVTELL